MLQTATLILSRYLARHGLVWYDLVWFGMVYTKFSLVAAATCMMTGILGGSFSALNISILSRYSAMLDLVWLLVASVPAL